jgi:hypothetical protein
MRARGPRLGELLESRDVLGRDQLLRALRNQKVVGGKLGTCLLEIDALPEEDLLAALAEQQGAPSVSIEEMRNIPRAVLDLVPAKVARVHQVVPFRASGTQIQVAMIDTRDLHALDELGFVTGRRVVPHVASEVRLLEALDRYYAVECPQRFVKLLDRMNRSRFLWRDEEESQPTEMLQWDAGLGNLRSAETTRPVALPPSPPPPVASAPAAAKPPTATRSPHEFVAPRPAPVAAVPPPPRPLSWAEAERRLLEPEDVDAVGATVADFAAGRADTVALFQVRRQEIVGWTGRGLDAVRLAALRVELDRPSIFFTLHEGAPLHLGPLSDLPAHAQLRSVLGSAVAAHELAVLPLRVRDRLVGALLVASAHGAPSAELIAELQRVTAKASIALELCIMRKKLRKA